MVPITFGELIPTGINDTNQNFEIMSVTQNDIFLAPRYVKILMDICTSASIIRKDFLRINKFSTKKTSTNKLSLMAGSFLTSCEAEVGIKLPELNTTNHISASFHVTDQKRNYDAIFGRDILRELGIRLGFQNNFVVLE